MAPLRESAPRRLPRGRVCAHKPYRHRMATPVVSPEVGEGAVARRSPSAAQRRWHSDTNKTSQGEAATACKCSVKEVAFAAARRKSPAAATPSSQGGGLDEALAGPGCEASPTRSPPWPTQHAASVATGRRGALLHAFCGKSCPLHRLGRHVFTRLMR